MPGRRAPVCPPPALIVLVVAVLGWLWLNSTGAGSPGALAGFFHQAEKIGAVVALFAVLTVISLILRRFGGGPGSGPSPRPRGTPSGGRRRGRA